MNYDDIKDKLKQCPFCGARPPELNRVRKGAYLHLALRCMTCRTKSGVVAAPAGDKSKMERALTVLTKCWNSRLGQDGMSADEYAWEFGVLQADAVASRGGGEQNGKM